MSSLQENKDYKLVEADDEHFLINLISGEYADVTYKYGHVRFTEEKNQLRIAFDFEIQDTPVEISEEDLKSDADFKKHISDILGNILSTETNFIIGNGNRKSREHNNKQSGSQ